MRTATSRTFVIGLIVALMSSVLVVLGMGATPAHAAVTPCPAPVVSAGEATVTCAFTGDAQTWTVPAGVTSATFDVQGAQGGNSASNGGLGGRAVVTAMAVTPGAVLNVFVGGAGPNATSGGAPGGFNGGGAASGSCCGSGGGASDIRVGGTALADRALIAGGGGGGGQGATASGGSGGGTTGGTGEGFFGGLGGNQDGTTGSGTLGVGGTGSGSAGGGGGYWGGAASNGGGGGGSGFGPAGVDFTNGFRAGNGVVKITYTLPDTTPPTVALSSAAPDPTNTSPIAVTAQFSEPVTGFGAVDVIPGNATVGNFVAVDGDTYTFDLTPSGQGLVTADIAAGVADDAAGNDNTAAVQFTRTFDSVAPTVTCSASPATLKSNNHKLASITTAVAVTNTGSGSAGFTLLSVASNQADSGAGPGDVPNDIQGWTIGTADTSGLLRIERYGTDRVYTLTYQGSDVAGNTATCLTTVTVKK